MKKNWKLDAESLGYKFIDKLGDILIIEKDDFIFKVHRSNWPPTRISASQCTDPTAYFKYQVKLVHGDKYDLSCTIFKGVDNDVTTTCSSHGEFSIPAKYLKSTRGCPVCGRKKASDKKKLTTDEFIRLANSAHNFKYNYTESVYLTAKSLINIKCPIHGQFQMQAHNHISGKGCVKCGIDSSSASRRLTLDVIIERFNSLHKNRYDYSNVIYNGDAHEHLSIICKEHGIFKQSYANHNSGKGCPLCAREFSPRLKRGFIKSGNNKNYASLYLIKCYDNYETFYKIGITTKPIKRRFSGQSSLPYDYELINLFISDPSTIWDIEKFMHRAYKNVKYIPIKEFGGRYECFSHVDVFQYQKLLDSVNL